jgi:hypothetical protein
MGKSKYKYDIQMQDYTEFHYRTVNTKVEAKTRTTMIIRLHPGSSKRISAYLEHQVVNKHGK